MSRRKTATRGKKELISCCDNEFLAYSLQENLLLT